MDEIDQLIHNKTKIDQVQNMCIIGTNYVINWDKLCAINI